MGPSRVQYRYVPDISDDQVKVAAGIDADSFIRDLPLGYDAPVSESVVRVFQLVNVGFLLC